MHLNPSARRRFVSGSLKVVAICQGIVGVELKTNIKQYSATIIFASLFLTIGIGCTEDWNCTRGACVFHHDGSACVTRDAYDRLSDEFVYVQETGNTARIEQFYSHGSCKRFPKGTKVHVLDGGVFTVKVRFLDLPTEPDRWMSSEFLRPA